ncbi:response regulator [Aquisalimonas lutea]|uniref:response regulator transcription factor n=1 Tax=Aquisalimonas lutea TaxID=1327750 RepID=UPI0025B43C25|nr:response regulator [Aquisalimonas lutea]MDN3519087.1 response regulator [Aquisalimonas lutea]
MMESQNNRVYRLLLVEDDEAFCAVAASALRRRGFDVRVAASGDVARRMASDFIPEYAVLDLRLGEDSGLSLLPTILEHAPDCHVVVLTGYASIATAVEAIKLGAVNYLTKPASIDELLDALYHHDPDPDREAASEPISVRRATWEHVQRVLREAGGNVSEAARRLGMHRRTVQRILNKRPPAH